MRIDDAVVAPVLLTVALLTLPLSDARPAVAQSPAGAAAVQVPTPEEHFGYRMGADGRLADWDELLSYYRLLAEASDRIQLVEMGPSTLGNPFIALYISSAENLARLDEIQRLNATLADPRGASEAEIRRAVEDGRAVIVQSYGLHSTEVAGAQTPAELVYEMATRTDPEMRRILDQVVGIMLPSLNPDGTTMVAEWVRETADTEYEGARLPWLYHHYIGHDNNRDAFQQNTAESFYTAQILFRDWVPQAFVDHHQMGAWGPRLYIPPYAEPIRPDGDPLVWREMALWGSHMAYALEEEEKAGVTGSSIYSGWGHFGFHWITPFHNTAGMLTESASARMAWPLFVHPDQLEGRPGRGLPAYEEQVSFPNPWEGGWWTVRDIVEQQKIATMATLDLAARNREMLLRNHYEKAIRQTRRGEAAEPVSRGPSGDLAAFIIPAEQHDRYTATELVEKLLLQGIDVSRATESFTHEGRVYGEGSWIVSLAQPKRGVIRWLLGQTFYPDNTYTRYRDGDPIPPYDMSTDNMAEYMGVRAVPVATHVEASQSPVRPRIRVTVEDRLPLVTSGIEPAGEAVAGRYGYLLDGRWNHAFQAVNQLLDRGVDVRRVDRPLPGSDLRPGDFVLPTHDAVADVAAETGLVFAALDEDPSPVSRPLSRLRVGMYQRYYGGNMDEGWTRMLLEMYDFPYESLMDERIREGELEDDFDVIILPSDNPGTMKGPGQDGGSSYYQGFPPEYRSGFGDEGVRALESFVENGGTLVTFGGAGSLAIDEFDLPVRNVVGGLPSSEFWSPGSTLRVDLDTDHALAYGMPERALAMFLRGSQAYEVQRGDHSERVDRLVVFPRAGEGSDQNEILESGWLLGEDRLSEKAAMLSVGHGEGRVVLIGFRPQHRAQTHGTFKLVFNALLSGPGTD